MFIRTSGGVHDNGIVLPAPADLTFHEFGAVIHDPADRSVLQSRAPGILPGPGHHAPGGVHMAHRGPRGRAGHGGSAGIGKKIEHGDGAVCLADALQRSQSGECGRNHPYLCPDHSGLPDRAELAAVCRAYGELRLRPGRRQGLGAECAVSGTMGEG